MMKNVIQNSPGELILELNSADKYLKENTEILHEIFNGFTGFKLSLGQADFTQFCKLSTSIQKLKVLELY